MTETGGILRHGYAVVGRFMRLAHLMGIQVDVEVLHYE